MTKRTMYRYIKYLLLVGIGVAIGFFVKGKFFSHAQQAGFGGGATASVLVKT